MPQSCSPVRQGRITEVELRPRRHVYVSEYRDLIGSDLIEEVTYQPHTHQPHSLVGLDLELLKWPLEIP